MRRVPEKVNGLGRSYRADHRCVCLDQQNLSQVTGGTMKTRINGRNMILLVLFASVLVVLVTTGAFAQTTASIKAFFVKETPAVQIAPSIEQQPTTVKQ